MKAYTAEYYNDLAHRAHAMAVEKGWWEGNRSYDEIAVLIHSEISEAAEELRNGNKPDHTYHREADGKPEGFPSEIADVVIRIADYIGATKFSSAFEYKWFDDARKVYRPGGWHQFDQIVVGLSMMHQRVSTGALMLVIIVCERIAEMAGFDLAEAIQHKMEFNAKRPARHGGKVF